MESEAGIAQLPHTASPRDSRYEVILTTAARLIHERGYQAVTMRDLALAVGIKMPSLYYHFESKEQILYAIARRTMITLIEKTNSVLRALGDVTVGVRLGAAIRVGVRFHLENQADAGVVLSESRNLGDECLRDVRQLMKDYEKIFSELVRQGIESGEFGKRDVTMATYVMLSALTRISIWYRPDGRLPSRTVEDEYANLLLDMVRVRESAESLKPTRAEPGRLIQRKLRRGAG